MERNRIYSRLPLLGLLALMMGCFPVATEKADPEPIYYANLSPASLTLRPGQPGRLEFHVTASRGYHNPEVNKLAWSIENAPSYPVGSIATAPGQSGSLPVIRGDYLSPSSLPEGVTRVTFTIRARYGPFGSYLDKTIETTSQVTLDVNAPGSQDLP